MFRKWAGVAVAFVVAVGATVAEAQPPPAPPMMVVQDPAALDVNADGIAPLNGPFPAPAAELQGVLAPGVADVERVLTWPSWFAGASGLVMTRTLPSGATTSILPGTGGVLSTSDASANWPGGVDLRLGRWFGAQQRHAVELIYWGVYNMGSAATVADPNNGLDAVPQAPGVTVGGQPAASFLTNARSQQIARSDLVNDIEINWVVAPWGRPEYHTAAERPVTLMWLMGFRFFELQDVLTMTSLAGTAPAGSNFGVNGGADQIAFNVATNNNLYGGQIGGKFDWHFLPSVRLSVVKKFMLAGNSITNTSTMVGGNGTTAVFAGGSPVQVHSTAGTVSYLGSIDAALAWDITPHWSLFGGYRVVGVGNVAQADQSWPVLISSPGSLTAIDPAGSTLIHGAFVGFEGRY